MAAAPLCTDSATTGKPAAACRMQVRYCQELIACLATGSLPHGLLSLGRSPAGRATLLLLLWTAAATATVADAPGRPLLRSCSQPVRQLPALAGAARRGWSARVGALGLHPCRSLHRALPPYSSLQKGQGLLLLCSLNGCKAHAAGNGPQLLDGRDDPCSGGSGGGGWSGHPAACKLRDSMSWGGPRLTALRNDAAGAARRVVRRAAWRSIFPLEQQLLQARYDGRTSWQWA